MTTGAPLICQKCRHSSAGLYRGHRGRAGDVAVRKITTMPDNGDLVALLVIDVQQGFDDERWGRRNNLECEANVSSLITHFRSKGWPIVFVRHDSATPDSPLRPDQSGNNFKPEVHGEADLVVVKNVNSAFYGSPDLHSWLTDRSIQSVAICGIQTNMCCETTARMAGNLGYETLFVLDATHTYDLPGPDGVVISAEDLTRVTAANLHTEFATVVSTAEILNR